MICIVFSMKISYSQINIIRSSSADLTWNYWHVDSVKNFFSVSAFVTNPTVANPFIVTKYNDFNNIAWSSSILYDNSIGGLNLPNSTIGDNEGGIILGGIGNLKSTNVSRPALM